MKRIIAMALAGLSLSVNAAWTLDADNSKLHFVSTKNQNIAEVHQFTQLSATLSDEGALLVKVMLDSVDTGIAIRDTRMREKLFVTSEQPVATLETTLDKDLLRLPISHSKDVDIEAKVTINGVSQNESLNVRVTRVTAHQFQASSVKPLLLNAANYNLDGGVGKLQEIAGLAGISLSVPVSFDIVMRKD